MISISTKLHERMCIKELVKGIDKWVLAGVLKPTPISPTPVSPTLDQKVAFRLLIKNWIFGHQSDVKLHLEVG